VTHCHTLPTSDDVEDEGNQLIVKIRVSLTLDGKERLLEGEKRGVSYREEKERGWSTIRECGNVNSGEGEKGGGK
jgi:hypothetical protein